jgi:hypothetical protein
MSVRALVEGLPGDEIGLDDGLDVAMSTSEES